MRLSFCLPRLINFWRKENHSKSKTSSRKSMRGLRSSRRKTLFFSLPFSFSIIISTSPGQNMRTYILSAFNIWLLLLKTYLYPLTKLIEENTKEEFAIQMTKAILVSENIYNTSELLHQKVIKSLEKSMTNGWLFTLLKIFDTGNVQALHQFHSQNKHLFQNDVQLK